MTSQSAPQDLLKAPREAAGKQFALFENKGRCREVGECSHRVGFAKRTFELF